MRRNHSQTTLAVLTIMAVVLVLAPAVRAALKYSVIYDFKDDKDGFGPTGWLVSDEVGNFYGVTGAGGVGCPRYSGCGTVFELRRTKRGWSHEVLYRFRGGEDGRLPFANLTLDAAGNLYGTTHYGGTTERCVVHGEYIGCGTVFKLAWSGGKWKETVLYRFRGRDGAYPLAGVVLDSKGNLYGTTQDGGNTSCYCGTVFELSSDSNGKWTETILHAFSGKPDGAGPTSLIFDSRGNLYGLAVIGGTDDEGAAFELSPTAGGGWSEATIYNFTGFEDGAYPGNGLTFDGRNLYGATTAGGSDDFGTIFELEPKSDGSWAQSVLYSFTGGKDGRYPASPFVFDKSGNLFGNILQDQECEKGYKDQCGNVFELVRGNGGQWRLKVLHSFAGGIGGADPFQVVFGQDGSLYGGADIGGDGSCSGLGCGLLFEVTP